MSDWNPITEINNVFERARKKYKRGNDWLDLIRKLSSISLRMEMKHSREECTEECMVADAEEARDTAIELVDSIRASYSMSDAYHIRNVSEASEFYKKKYEELKEELEELKEKEQKENERG